MRHFIILAILGLAACVEEPIDGRTAYLENCARCHGADGMGGGPAARDLAVAPPDLTTIAARNGGVFPTNQVMSTIDGLDSYRRRRQCKRCRSHAFWWCK